MRCIVILLMMCTTVSMLLPQKVVPKVATQKIGAKGKKAKFYALVNPAVQKVHKQLFNEFETIKKEIKAGTNQEKIEALKKSYGVQTDKELLFALKPHPQSIALAQAAMESAWGTSRLFRKSNNLFGMWSVNPNEPRVAANQQRDGNKTIWLRKFSSVEGSVKAYYKLIATGKTYKAFRKARYYTNDPYKMILKLDKYSELGAKYPKELGSMMRYNKLTRYD